MAFNTPLITSTQAITEAIPDVSFDEQRLDKFILPAQRQYLRTAIGIDFYDTLLDEKAADNFSTENQTLYDNFIISMLSWFVVYDALPTIRNNITPQGIMINNTQFSQQSSREDFAALRNSVVAQAERWKKDMIIFIDEQQDLDSSAFPDFSRAKDRYQSKKGIILYPNRSRNHNGFDHDHDCHCHHCE